VTIRHGKVERFEAYEFIRKGKRFWNSPQGGWGARKAESGPWITYADHVAYLELMAERFESFQATFQKVAFNQPEDSPRRNICLAHAGSYYTCAAMLLEDLNEAKAKKGVES